MIQIIEEYWCSGCSKIDKIYHNQIFGFPKSSMDDFDNVCYLMGHLSVYRIILFSHHLPGECKI
jgi:hypothetical protein